MHRKEPTTRVRVPGPHASVSSLLSKTVFFQKQSNTKTKKITAALASRSVTRKELPHEEK